MRVLTKVLIASLLAGFTAVTWADPGKARVFQTSPVINADTMMEDGAAWLKRSKNRVDGRIMTTVDVPGAPYSVWWIIFNNPSACATSPCGFNDLLDGGKAARVAVFNASGAISALDGMGNAVINMDLSVIGGEGAAIGSQDPPDFPPWNGEAPGFEFLEPLFYRVLEKNNGKCAEIHLDINEHEMDSDWVSELTNPEVPQSFAVFPAAPGC